MAQLQNSYFSKKYYFFRLAGNLNFAERQPQQTLQRDRSKGQCRTAFHRRRCRYYLIDCLNFQNRLSQKGPKLLSQKDQNRISQRVRSLQPEMN